MRHLLTGATSGIGAEVARRLLARGDEVFAVVRDASRAPEGATVLVADLTDADALEALALPPALDSVVHAAGVVTLGAVGSLDAAAWEDQFRVNTLAPAVLTRLALPALRARGGTAVFVNSGAGIEAHAQWSAYAASKFALRALANSLRAEEPSIRVTSVFPGRTATPMQASVHAQEGREYDESHWIRPETVAELIIGAIDLPPVAVLPEVVVRPR